MKQNSSQNFVSLVGFQASEIWMFFSWKIYCRASFEIIFRQKEFPKTSCFFLFSIGFHMVWKNQESWELWLDGFWVNRNSKMQNFLPKIYQKEFQPVKYYLSRISTSRNIPPPPKKKKRKIQFISHFCWLFFNFALKTYGTLKMFLLCAQNNSHIVSSLYVEGHLKQNLSLDFILNFGCFPALQNLGVFFENLLWSKF